MQLRIGLLASAALAGCCGCSSAGDGLLARLAVTNVLDQPVESAGVTVPLRPRWEGTQHFLVQQGDVLLPCQADDLTGDGKRDELFFQMDLPASGSRTVLLWSAEQPAEYKKRVDAFVQRTEALARPVWESERLGFCSYGSAKLDLFGKTTPRLTGALFFDEELHSPHELSEDWGMDFMPVGLTLGAGGIFVSEIPNDRTRMTRPWTVNSVRERELLRPYHDAQFEFRVLSEGPIRAIVQSDITNWRTARGQYAVRLLYLMEAGKRHCEVRLRLRRAATKSRRLLVGSGFAKLREEVAFGASDSALWAVSEKVFDPVAMQVVADRQGLALGWEKQALDSTLLTEEDEGNHLVLLRPETRRSVRLWHAAAWDRDGGIESADQWRETVERLSQEFNNPPVVTLGKP